MALSFDCKTEGHDWYYSSRINDFVSREKEDYRVCGLCGKHQHKEWSDTNDS